MNQTRYKQIVIGIDQSYKNTGISLIADGKIKDIKSVRLDKLKTNADKRGMLRCKLEHLMSVVTGKTDNIVCIVERTRVHGGKRRLENGHEIGFINVDTIKAMGVLTALTVDIMYQYGINVYSVDTRSWKAQVIGTSKPESNTYGVPDEKWPTVKWVIDQGFENKILIDVTNTRKQKGTFMRDGRKYMYNDDAADSAGIGMFWIKGDRSKLQLER